LGGVMKYDNINANSQLEMRLKKFGAPTYYQTVWPRVTEFGVISMWRSSMFLGSPMPQSNGVRPQCPPNFWDLWRACTLYEKWQPNFACLSN